MIVPRQLTPGDPRHGVVRFAAELAQSVGAPGVAWPERRLGGTRVHAHFTDRLWGADPEAAAAAVERLAAEASLTVTLHDLPQASDGPTRLPRRVACYRRVVRAASAVACSSAHEAALLRDVVGADVASAVIPLPVTAAAPEATRPPADHEVALLGYIYPGKGHAEAIAAVAGLASAGKAGLGVTALGRASAGHEAELAQLVADAAARGVRLTVTGYLGEAALLERCRRAAVPLVAHRHVSASASLNSWVAAGRRPLVPDGRYARELAALRPGTIAIHPPDERAAAIDRARHDPASTWWGPEASLGPDLRDVADAYVAWWGDVAW